MGATVLFGLTPALGATAAGPLQALKEGRTHGPRFRLASSLVSVQVALSLVLLIGAGLFVRTLQNLRNLDLGFQTSGVLLIDFDAQRAGYRDEGLAVFFKQLLEGIERLPGVVSASLSISTPLGDVGLSTDVTISGPSGQRKANSHFNAVTPRYFETMRMPLVQGRDFTLRDDMSAPKRAVVNEDFVRRYFADGRPLGQHISIESDDIEIIGVVKDSVASSLRQAPPPAVYLGYFQQKPGTFNTLEVRASGALSQASVVIRNDLQSRLRTAVEVRTLTSQIERALVQERLMATLAGAFGVLALVMACVGLYGVLAYAVAQRTSEIGVRMALGAERTHVLWLIASNALRMLGVGVALGLPAAWAASRLVGSMLFGLTPTDPLITLGSPAVLILVGLLAGFIPARRASRVDPMVTLRYE
jgi:predicted permease